MDKKQYNNIIDYTLKHDKSAQTDDSLATARAVFKNMGVALPHGDIKEVFETIKSGNYMSWRSCTMKEAQAAANQGIAAIGISDKRILVLSANDEEQPITKTTSVMSISENTSAFEVDGLKYFSYGRGRCGGGCGGSANLHFANNSLNVKVGWTGYNTLCGCTGSTIYWCSSNTNVVTVDSMSGYIHAVGVGSATITASICNGEHISYSVNVQAFKKTVSTSKVIFGPIINDVLGAQVFNVTLNLTYSISRINGNCAYVDEISAFAKYDKGNMMFGIEYPDITIGALTVGENTYSMHTDTRPMWISPDWKWDAKYIEFDNWLTLGTNISTLAIVMLDASLFSYRDVHISTTLALS